MRLPDEGGVIAHAMVVWGALAQPGTPSVGQRSRLWCALHGFFHARWVEQEDSWVDRQRG